MRLLAHNMHEALAQPSLMPPAVDHIMRSAADIAILSDAYSLHNPQRVSDADVWDQAKTRLETAGYIVAEAEYDDTMPWSHDRHLVILSRLEVVGSHAVRLGSRNGWEMVVPRFGEVRVVGAHFDDRSREARLGHIAAFLDSIQPEQCTVLAGDLNFPSTTLRSRLLHPLASERLAAHVPGSPWRERIERGMAVIRDVDLMTMLNNGGFQELPGHKTATFPAHFPLLRLDHVLASEGLGGYTRPLRCNVSAHLGVMATLWTHR